MSLGVGIRLDQPTVRETANNAKVMQITREHGQGARLEAMSLNLRLRYLRYSRFPLLASMRIPRAMTLAGKGSGETARYRRLR